MSKRVLFVVPSLQGGAGIAMQEIISELETLEGGQEFSVSRIVLDNLDAGWNPAPSRCAALKASINRLLWKPINFITARAGLPRTSWPILDTGFGKLIDSGEFDLVFLGWLGEGSLSIREIQALTTPFCYRYSDLWPLSGLSHYDPPPLKKSNQLLFYIINAVEERLVKTKLQALSRATLAISPSLWVAERHRAMFTDSNLPVTVIPNLLKPAPLHLGGGGYGEQGAESSPAEKFLRLCFVAPGRLLDERKGGPWLRRLISELDRQLLARWPTTRVHFTVIGRGTFRSRFKAVRVTHLANQPRERIQLELDASDILLFLSRQDNSPNVALEAMAQSCLILGFESPGIREVVGDDLSRWLSPYGDFASVVRNLEHFMERDFELEALKRKAAALVRRRNSPEVIGDLYVKVLRDALDMGR